MIDFNLSFLVPYIPEIVLGSIFLVVAYFFMKESDGVNLQLEWNYFENSVEEAVENLFNRNMNEKGNISTENPNEEDVDRAVEYVKFQAQNCMKRLKIKDKHLRRKLLARYSMKCAETKQENRRI